MFEESNGVEGTATTSCDGRQLAWDSFRGTAGKTNLFESMRWSLIQWIDAS